MGVTMQITVLNGWRDAPHQWWRFLLVPIWVSPYPSWRWLRRSRTVQLQLLGLAVFITV